jgi:hypothetical protein
VIGIVYSSLGESLLWSELVEESSQSVSSAPSDGLFDEGRNSGPK